MKQGEFPKKKDSLIKTLVSGYVGEHMHELMKLNLLFSYTKRIPPDPPHRAPLSQLSVYVYIVQHVQFKLLHTGPTGKYHPFFLK
jgi:hypothetical protein